MKKTSGSKKLAKWLVGIATALTGFAIYQGLEGVAISIWTTGIPAAIGLYANKQYQDRKWAEIKKD